MDAWMNDHIWKTRKFFSCKQFKGELPTSWPFTPRYFNVYSVKIEKHNNFFYSFSWLCGIWERVRGDSESGHCYCFPESCLLIMFFLPLIWPLLITAKLYTEHTPVSFLLPAPIVIMCKTVHPHVHRILADTLLAREHYEKSLQNIFLEQLQQWHCFKSF